MKHLLSVLAFSLLASATVVSADTKTTDKKVSEKATVSDGDVQVMAELHHANQSEIDMATYAGTHATARGVKDYALMIVKDHTANDKELQAVAKKKGLSVIPKPATGTKESDDAMSKLEAAKTADFDRMYIDMMVMDHQKDLGKVTNAIATIKDADVKAHFTATKPVLEKHLADAKKLQPTDTHASK
jgi:putative membrane protein